MKKLIAFHNYYEIFNKNNYMFNNINGPIGDNLLSPFLELKAQADANLIETETVDVVDLDKVNAFVFLDMPKLDNYFFKFAIQSRKPSYLITFESELIKPDNFEKNNHKFFKKIFTFNDNLIDNKKYFKINYSHCFPKEIEFNFSKKEKLCTLIASNKKISHPLELYSKRLEAIRWFEENYPDSFDFYGVGWDTYKFKGNKLIRALNYIKPLTRLLAQNFSSYKGSVERKLPILQKYKYAICFENARDIPGYITEKIFDCFFAGCVPIYYGANNITEHIPEQCFIDFRKFKTYKELYAFMMDMTNIQYFKYIENIEEFLKSKNSYQFSVDCFAKTLLKEID